MRDTLAGLRDTIKAKDEVIVALSKQRDDLVAACDAYRAHGLEREQRAKVALAALNTIATIAEATR